MQRLLQSFAPLRGMRYKRALTRFLDRERGHGVEIAEESVVETLGMARTLTIDACLLLEGADRVRCACAPLALCGKEAFKRQPSWMMLTAAVALGCADYAPLETFAEEMNFAPARMAQQYPLVKRLEYDDERGVETTLHREGAALRAYAKGAPEEILKKCAMVQEGKPRLLTAADRRSAAEAAEEMEREGLMPLAFATKPLAEDGADAETDMIYLGMVAVGDAPNGDAPRYARTLGELMRPVLLSERMLPEELLRATGLVRPDAHVMTGDEALLLEDARLTAACAVCDAFIGMDETQRARIAQALRTASHAPVAAVGRDACGDVTASFVGGAADVCLGGPEMLASLVRGCRTFLNENAYQQETYG